MIEQPKIRPLQQDDLRDLAALYQEGIPHAVFCALASRFIEAVFGAMINRSDACGFAAVAVEQLQLPTDADCVLLRYPVSIRDKPRVLRLPEAINVDLAGWYDSPIHPLQGDALNTVRYRGQCPAAEAAILTLVHLPTDTSIPAEKLKQIAHLLARAVE